MSRVNIFQNNNLADGKLVMVLNAKNVISWNSKYLKMVNPVPLRRGEDG